MTTKKLSLIGSGKMAEDYIKVLKVIGIDFNVVSKNYDRIEYLKYTYNVDAYCYDVKEFEQLSPTFVINCVDIASLFEVNLFLLKAGVKNILCEKPVAFEMSEVEELLSYRSSNLVLALNRRFYDSTLKAQELLLKDGGPRTCSFQFNERTLDWLHPYSTPGQIENRRPIHSQSIHLIDLVFHLIGSPREFVSLSKGNNYKDYYFSGSGSTDLGCLFSFTSDWKAPGSWFLDVTTKNHRIKFEPVENLIIQKYTKATNMEKKNGLINHFISINEPKFVIEDKQMGLKPGLFMQTDLFLKKDFSKHGSLSEYIKILDFINSFSL
jgi:predicted dehydrogenase